MGIYPSKPTLEFATDRANGSIMHKTWDTGYGEVVVETWVKICEIRDRKTCFCCSCGDREGSDIACRNHGWAAKRPCEKHGTPGTAWGEEMCTCENHLTRRKPTCLMGKMPETVQEVQAQEEGK